MAVEDVARVLGATQEADRLSSPVIATEHLLIATLTCPIVRQLFLRSGVQLRDVQGRVDEASRSNRVEDASDTSRLTSLAAEVLEQVEAEVTQLRAESPATPAVISIALRRTLTVLLTHPADSAAGVVLRALFSDHARDVLLRDIDAQPAMPLSPLPGLTPQRNPWDSP